MGNRVSFLRGRMVFVANTYAEYVQLKKTGVRSEDIMMDDAQTPWTDDEVPFGVVPHLPHSPHPHHSFTRPCSTFLRCYQKAPDSSREGLLPFTS